MHCFLYAHNKLQCIHKYKIPHLSLQHSLFHTHRSLRTIGYFSKISGVLEFSFQSASLTASLHHIHEVTQAHMLPLSLVVAQTHTRTQALCLFTRRTMQALLRWLAASQTEQRGSDGEAKRQENKRRGSDGGGQTLPPGPLSSPQKAA